MNPESSIPMALTNPASTAVVFNRVPPNHALNKGKEAISAPLGGSTTLESVFDSPERSDEFLPSRATALQDSSQNPGSIIRMTEASSARTTSLRRSHSTIMAEQASKRLRMKHVERRHKCEHCQKIQVDFRKSFRKVMSMSPRPYEGMRVWCADSFADVVQAKEDACPFFIHSFRGPSPQEDTSNQSGPQELKIGGYDLRPQLLTGLGLNRSAEENVQIETWKRRYYLFYQEKDDPKSLGWPGNPPPNSFRLCNDPDSG